LLLAVLFVMVFSCASAGATNDVVKSLSLKADPFAQTAFDGGDVYWTYTRKVKVSHGLDVDTIVKRTSFLDGTTSIVFVAQGKKSEEISDLKAGGGVLAIGLSRQGLNPDHTLQTLETEVIRVQRDGSGQQMIAAGNSTQTRRATWSLNTAKRSTTTAVPQRCFPMSPRPAKSSTRTPTVIG
jgi:hypothetical protein